MSWWNMWSTTKYSKSEMGQTLWDGWKWKNGTIFVGRREYLDVSSWLFILSQIKIYLQTTL